MILNDQIELRAIYADTDAEGVVYYGTYLAWLEKGRTELLRSIGLNVKNIKDRYNIIFAVKDLKIDYQKPVVYDELIIVASSIVEVKGCRINFLQKIIKEDLKNIALVAELTLVSLQDKIFKPIKIPKDLANKINV